MSFFRFLDPLDPTDHQHLESILDHYLEFEKNRQIKLYSYESVERMVAWYKSSFQKFSQKDFVVCSKFENNELEKIIIAFKLKLVLSDQYNTNPNDILPYSYLALVYHKNKTWGSPEEDMDALSTLASEHFESQGITKMLLTVRLSRKILKTSNVEEFLNQELVKTFPNTSGKYFLSLEAVFFNQDDLNKYNYSIFRKTVPLHIHKPVMIISWNLKPACVLKNYIKNNENKSYQNSTV